MKAPTAPELLGLAIVTCVAGAAALLIWFVVHLTMEMLR